MVFILAFLLAGIILILGFLGDYLFKRTRIPDVLILIFLGFLLGPLFKVIDPGDLSSITTLFASLALLVILFDGGLNFDLFKVFRNSPRALVLAFLGIFFSMIVTGIFAIFVLKWNLLNGLLLGAIVGGTSSSIVLPIITRMKVHENISTVLSLESIFTDALVVVIAITLLQLLQTPANGNEFSIIASGIASQFSIGIVIGGVLGVVWLKVLKHIKGQKYDDILTLAIVMLFFALVELLNGNGAIFALTFGLVLGNGRIISRMLKISDSIEASKIMKKFQSQISFLIRTFFFVYLGLIFSVGNFTLLVYGIILTFILLITRYLAVYVTSLGNPILNGGRKILTLMLPRGLAAAVMAQIVSTSNIPNASIYTDIVITVIIASVVISSLGSFFASTKQPVKTSEDSKLSSK
ncbi:MAG TPA: cation:proton antiporter [archaeon]|nr:cation:proton antiporter [archaeon]